MATQTNLKMAGGWVNKWFIIFWVKLLLLCVRKTAKNVSTYLQTEIYVP